MSSYNTAMIIDYGRKKYGLDLSDQDAQTVMNASGGGDPSKLDSAFMMRPDVQQKTALDNAKKAQQFQVEANQPAIQTLNQHKTDLDGKYTELLASIKNTQDYETGQADIASKQGLAARGINPEDELGMQMMNKGRLPVSTQFGQLTANAGLSRQQDLTGLASQIASLQAGNPLASLNFGNSVMSLWQQAQQIANQLELGREQNSISRMNAETAQKGGGNKDQYTTIGEGATLWDLFNNKAVYTAPKTYKASGGGGGETWY